MSENTLRTVLEVEDAGYKQQVQSDYVDPSKKAATDVAAALRLAGELFKNYGKESLDRIAAHARETKKSIEDAAKSPLKPTFAEDYKRAFDDITKRAQTARDAAQKFSEVRIGKGQFDVAAQGAVVAVRRIEELQLTIRSLRAESAKPGNQGLLKNFQEDIFRAEKELSQLEFKVKQFKQSGGGIGGNNGGGGAGGGPGGGFLNDFGSNIGGSLLAGGAAGLAAGAVIGAAQELKAEISAIVGEVKDLSIEAVRLAANFEETTNSIAVFSGSTASAKEELSSLDAIALKTNGLRLESAEEGYRRLRALGFEAKTATDLVVGLGKQRLISGTSEQNVQRVVTHFEQIAANPENAKRDFKFAVRDLPTLRNSFKDAFGTSDYGELQKLVAADPTKFFDKLASSMANSKQAAAGLNIAIEKGQDALVSAGRIFGEPLLDPLTKDIQELTKYLNENGDSFARWGQTAADAIQGLSDVARGAGSVNDKSGGGLFGATKFGARALLFASTYGASEGVIGGVQNFAEIGKQAREKEEAQKFQQKIAEGIADGVDIQGTTYKLDPLTNTIQAIGDAVEKLPSLTEQLQTDKALKEAAEIRSTFAETLIKNQSADVSQNLEISKAKILRDYKDDSLKSAKATTALEVQSLRDQIVLADKLLKTKIANLTPEEKASGKGLLFYQDNAASVAGLNNQILLTQINLQKQTGEEIRKNKLDFREFIVSLQSQENPFLKIFSDIESVNQRAKKFGAFAGQAANADLEDQLKKLNTLRYQTTDSALKLRQDARRLSLEPEHQRGEFKREFADVQERFNYEGSRLSLQREINSADFYGYQYNPNNPKSYDDARFSFAERSRFGEAAGGRGRNEKAEDYQKRFAEAVQLGIELRDAVKDVDKLKTVSVGNTGILGQAESAKQLLKILPEQNKLIAALSSPYASEKETAFGLLQERAKALSTLQGANDQTYKDFQANQEFLNLGRTDAQERLKNLRSSGLTERQKNEEFVNITSELGSENLTPELRRGKIEAENNLARLRLAQEAKGLKTQVQLLAVLSEIDKKLGGKGIKLDLAQEAFLNVVVQSEGITATTSKNAAKKATNADVQDSMGIAETYALTKFQR